MGSGRRVRDGALLAKAFYIIWDSTIPQNIALKTYRDKISPLPPLRL